jgi:TonB-dependent SusC/RagA subfamily outer membrane receptor
MIAQLMVYSLVTAAFLGLAGVAAEAALRTYHRPARWVWPLALMGSIALPISSLVANGLRVESANPTLIETIAGKAETALLPPVLGSLTAPRAWSSYVDLPLLGLWAAASAGLLIVLVWSARRLARERTGWAHVRIGNTTAWLSEDTGPAVVGVFQNSIVVPAWVLELEQDIQQLISLHEEEHLKAGDLRLMLTGLLFVLLAPWNPAIWWQLRRLRLALEADCDVRVLRQGADVLTYSSLLLEVGGRSAQHHLPALAFIKKTSTLARRIHLMTWQPRMRAGRAAAAVGLMAVFGVLACETPTPPQAEETVEIAELAQPRIAAEDDHISLEDSISVVRLRTTRVMPPVLQGTEPLFIIDGVIVGSGKLDAVDVATIESIQVIKGAAAEAQYGERATNGVVLITTKDGAELPQTAQLVRIKEKN